MHSPLNLFVLYLFSVPSVLCTSFVKLDTPNSAVVLNFERSKESVDSVSTKDNQTEAVEGTSTRGNELDLERSADIAALSASSYSSRELEENDLTSDEAREFIRALEGSKIEDDEEEEEDKFDFEHSVNISTSNSSPYSSGETEESEENGQLSIEELESSLPASDSSSTSSSFSSLEEMALRNADNILKSKNFVGLNRVNLPALEPRLVRRNRS